MNMKAPQIIYLVLTAINLLTSANLHGKPKSGNNTFWSALISAAIFIPLLWWGGFFN